MLSLTLLVTVSCFLKLLKLFAVGFYIIPTRKSTTALKLSSPLSYMHMHGSTNTMTLLKIKHFLVISLATAIFSLIVSLRFNNSILPLVIFMFNCSCKTQNIMLLSNNLCNTIAIAIPWHFSRSSSYLLSFCSLLYISNVISLIMAFSCLLISLRFHSTILIIMYHVQVQQKKQN